MPLSVIFFSANDFLAVDIMVFLTWNFWRFFFKYKKNTFPGKRRRLIALIGGDLLFCFEIDRRTTIVATTYMCTVRVSDGRAESGIGRFATVVLT